MILTIVIGIIITVSLLSSLLFYVFMRTQDNDKSSMNEKQQVKYSFRPSFDIITKKLNQDTLLRASMSSTKSNISSTTLNNYEENELKTKKQRKSVESINSPIIPIRSSSMVTNLFQPRRPRSANWRQGSIVNPNQLALIQFSLPPTNSNTKYRRRSVAICNNIIEPKENLLTTQDSTSSCLLSFSITYLKTSQIKIQFHSVTSIPSRLQLHQLTIKVKLAPDGKEKSIQIRKILETNNIFDEEYFILFSNVSSEKFPEKSLTMNIHGKDQTRKTVNLGQIGKINFNQINKWENENRVDFLHEMEKMKPSSVELLISLAKKGDQHLHVDLQRIKGFKVDQKNLNATCYLQVHLLDRHRPLSIHQTKSYRLNSSNFIIGEQFDLNILTHNSNNLDRLMLLINLYSNSNTTKEYRCIARVKIASPLFCSGSGSIHWQQFKARESFSMWHTLNKQQQQQQ